MRGEYAYVTPRRRENLQAAAVAVGIAAGIGAVAFYLARILLSREVLEATPRAADESPEAR